MEEWRNVKKKENKIEKERANERKNGETEEKKEIMNTNPWCRLGLRAWLDQGISKRTGFFRNGFLYPDRRQYRVT